MAHRASNQQRSAWTVSLVAPRAGESLLEIGCGPGLALALAASSCDGVKLVGLDHSATMIAQARRRLESLAPGTEWSLVEGTWDHAAEWPERFDAVWSVNVIQFLPDVPRAFAVVSTVLKPGGRVVTTYQPRHKNPTRMDALRKADEIEAAMKLAGFVDVRTELLELKPVPAVAVIGFKP